MIEGFVPTRLFTLVRFGMWDDVLQAPQPPGEFPYATAMRHYARGLTFVEKQRLDDARQELTALREVHATIPADRLAGRHPMVNLVEIAARILEAKVAAAQRNTAEAIASLEKAVELQDALQYDEPPPWFYPVRQTLGAVQLAAGRVKDAEAVYRQDLKEHPENGWALFGLAACLKAQNSPQAREAQERFEKAWAESDVRLRSSEN